MEKKQEYKAPVAEVVSIETSGIMDDVDISLGLELG